MTRGSNAPDDVEIRPATAADLPAIVALLADDPLGRARERPGPPIDPAYARAFKDIADDPNQRLVVLSAGLTDPTPGRILGCLQLTIIPGLSRLGMTRAQVESVRVAADRRTDGLGRRLLIWAIETAAAEGCGLVQLTTDKSRPDALRFYESLGFEASHEGLKRSLRRDD